MSNSRQSQDSVTSAQDGLSLAIENALAEIAMSDARHHWLADEPSPDCFADDVLASERFLYGPDSPEKKQHQSHLRTCGRCLYQILQLREFEREWKKHEKELLESLTRIDSPQTCTQIATQPEQLGTFTSQRVPWIDRLRSWGLLTIGNIRFSNGTEGRRVWQFGRLLKADDGNARLDEISAAVLPLLLTAIGPALRDEIVLVAHSDVVHRVAVRVATEIKKSRHRRAHVVRVMDNLKPRLLCNCRRMLPGRTVVLMTDVIHGGDLAERIWAIINRENPARCVTFSMIDQSYNGPLAPIVSLATENKEERETSFDGTFGPHSRQVQKYYHFDSDRALATPIPPAEIERKAIRRRVKTCMNKVAEWLPLIGESNALKSDHKIGKIRYPIVIDVLALLRNENGRIKIKEQASKVISEPNTCKQTTAVYPAARHQRAGKVAALLKEAFGWNVCPLGDPSQDRALYISDRARQEIESARHLVIVDAAIRTGATLKTHLNLIREAEICPAEVSAFYIVNGLDHREHRVLEKSLGLTIRGLIEIPLPLFGPSESISKYHQGKLKEVINLLEQRETESFWTEAIKRYCKRKLLPARSHRRLRPDVAQTLENAGVERELQRYGGNRRQSALHVLTEYSNEVSHGRRHTSPIRRMEVDTILENQDVQEFFRGWLYNSDTDLGVLEVFAMALASQGIYDWLEESWFRIHERIFTDKNLHFWEMLAYLMFRLAQENPEVAEEKTKIVETVRKKLRRRKTLPLFDGAALKPVYEERLEALADALRQSA